MKADGPVDWITKTLHLTHARDYDVSLEALGCIYAFLEVRKLALPQKQIDSNEVSNQDSQDQFDELDYDDPILNAMLGGHVSVVEPQHQSDDLDRQLAMIIKKDLEPALQSVVNNFFVSPWILASRSYPERQRYLSTSIFCWVGCAAVLVSHGLKVVCFLVSRLIFTQPEPELGFLPYALWSQFLAEDW